MASAVTLDAIVEPTERHKFVLARYAKSIDYYWSSSGANKRAFKWTRLSTIILGSVVTLLASMTSSGLVDEQSAWKMIFAVGTPLFAAALTIISTLAQTFQWEATWRESVMTAERLQKELDRIRITEPQNLDAVQELDRLNSFVLQESESFFDRVLGRSKPPTGNGSN
jgi:hypothetical protein